jgi:hypothetical protein
MHRFNNEPLHFFIIEHMGINGWPTNDAVIDFTSFRINYSLFFSRWKFCSLECRISKTLDQTARVWPAYIINKVIAHTHASISISEFIVVIALTASYIDTQQHHTTGRAEKSYLNFFLLI